MPAVEDELITRLDLDNLSGYMGGFQSAAGAVGLLERALVGANSRQIAFGTASVAVAGLLGGGMIRATMSAASEMEAFSRAAGNFKGGATVAELEKFADGLSRLTGVDDGKIADMLGVLGTFQVSAPDAKSLALPILNASEALKALGLDATQVSNQVGKAIQTGDAGPLRRAGVVIDEVGFKSLTAAQRVEAVKKALDAQGGQAAVNFRNTFGGAVQALQTSLGNLEEGAGKGLVKPFTTAANAATTLVNKIEDLPEGALETVGVAAGVASLAFLGLGGRMLWSAGQAQLLAGANAKLMNENLKAAQSADKEGNEEADAARQMGAASGAAGVLTGKLGPLAVAHDTAALAADRHAAAEERLGRAMGGASGSFSGGGTRRGAIAGAGAAGKAGKAGVAASRPGVRPRGAVIPITGEAPASGGATAPLEKTQAFDSQAFANAGAGAAGKAGKAGGAASRFGKIGGFVARNAGKLKLPALIVADLAANAALEQVSEKGDAGGLKHLGQGALQGAGIGATIGSFIPGVGTAAGALTGGLIGGGKAAFDDLQMKSVEATSPKERAEMFGISTEGKGDSQILEEIRDAIQRGNRIAERQLAFGTGRDGFTGAEQMTAFSRMVG